MRESAGKYMILIGGVILVAGLLVYFFGDKWQWIGRLPGDIRIEKENTRFYFPVTTMILFSLVLTIILQLIKKFL